MSKTVFLCAILAAFGLWACESSQKTIPVTDRDAEQNTQLQTRPHDLVVDSASPGPGWKKLEPDNSAPSNKRVDPTLIYCLNPAVPTAIIGATYFPLNTETPEYAAAMLAYLPTVIYPGASLCTIVESSADKMSATFSCLTRHETRIVYYAYVRLPNVKGLVRLSADAHVADREVAHEAFITVLRSLTVK